jgi:choline dehydrogenase-like flavoprotein
MNSSELAQTHIGDELKALQCNGLDLQIAQYLPFRKKNLATLLDDRLVADENLTVLLNAVAADWQFSKGPGSKTKTSSVKAVCGTHTRTVAAQSFVVAAGALESARILLEMEQGTNRPLFSDEAAIGHYLGDHLSCPIARVQPEDRSTAASLFQPRFANGRMYYFRLLEAFAPDGSPRSFAHFIFENESPGFDLAKQVLQGWQARSFPSVSPSEIFRGMKGVLALGWDRFVNSKLHIPTDTPVRMQLDVEQQPSYNNQISLSGQNDEHGRPTPLVQWEIKDEDYEAIRQTARRLLERWPGSESEVPSLRSCLDNIEERKPHDAYHPVGVCRLGEEHDAVVTPQLRVRGTENLSVLSTAVFPTAGTANPTFSMLCFAEMLSARLQNAINRNTPRSEVS